MTATGSRRIRRSRWLGAFGTLLILTLVLVVASRLRTPESAALAPVPMAVAPGIYLLGGLAPAAAYAVDTSDGLVLIDCGLRAEFVRWELEALRLRWKRVRAILLTHVHIDHSGGAQELRAATGATIYAGRGDAAVLRQGQPREVLCSIFALPEAQPAPTTVDIELDDEQVVTIGDARFTVLATPGHTPGSVCYLMERGRQRVLFSGDVIMSLRGDDASSSRLLRPLGTYTTYLSPRYRGDAAAFLATLRRLRAMTPPQLVLPGHPRNDPTPQSPAMTPQRWQALLDPGIRDMERLSARYAREGVSFLDGQPKKLLADLYYLGDIQKKAVYGFFVASKFYVVNAPGGAGLNAFLESALSKLGLPPAKPSVVLLTSGNAETMAGLAEVIVEYNPSVVAPAEAWKEIEKFAPGKVALLTPEELSSEKRFVITPLALRGRGIAPLAYRMTWPNKSVLISGSIPIQDDQTAATALRREFSQGRANAADYRASLQRLADCRPDVWLPSSPVNGQSARLEVGEWQRILAANERLSR